MMSSAPSRSSTDTVARPALRCVAAGRATNLAPFLVFGYGNPSRGDDALGPLLIERLQQLQADGRLVGVELLTDFQLQVEHVLDLVGRERVILVDAALGLGEPYRLTPVVVPGSASAKASAPTSAERSPQAPPPWTLGWTTHRMTPLALAHLYTSLYGELPRLEQLAIGAEAFALGAGLSARAVRNLSVALTRLLELLEV